VNCKRDLSQSSFYWLDPIRGAPSSVRAGALRLLL
jgi:hypothetical protein